MVSVLLIPRFPTLASAKSVPSVNHFYWTGSLASAALPLAFPSQKVNGKSYVDGGLADNVPLRALAKRGCKNVIVIHLKNGAAWNRHDFPEQTVIEIRPSERIEKSDTLIIGKIDSYLDFSSERIAELKKRGYEDAKRCLIPIRDVFRTVKDQRQVATLQFVIRS